MSSGLEALNLMLVDDNPHARTVVVTLLQSLGVRNVFEASDGREALEMLKRWPADLALVDFKMSPMNGAELTRHVRTDRESRDPYLPIILMTGYTSRVRLFEARDAGVNEFLAKPVRARTLLDRIYAVVLNPRPFVRTATYFGPDRRRRPDPEHKGPWRRAGEPGAAAVTVAIEEDDLMWVPRA